MATAAELAGQYGYAQAFFGADPELQGLLDQAVRENWSTARFQSAFMASQWYRTREAATRQWDELLARDPNEAYNRIVDTKLHVRNLVDKMGLPGVGDAQLSDMVNLFLRFGYNDEAITSYLGNLFELHNQFQEGGTGGQSAQVETDIKRAAMDYGVTVSDPQLQDWIGGMLAGRYTPDTYNDYIRDMARSKYPGLQKYIDAGITVKQYAQPYMQSYSQILEVSPDAVTVDDPLLQKALQGTMAAPKQGAQGEGQLPNQPMSVYQFEQGLRQDPRWQYTGNAKKSYQDAAIGIAKDMGLYT